MLESDPNTPLSDWAQGALEDAYARRTRHKCSLEDFREGFVAGLNAYDELSYDPDLGVGWPRWVFERAILIQKLLADGVPRTAVEIRRALHTRLVSPSLELLVESERVIRIPRADGARYPTYTIGPNSKPIVIPENAL